MNTYGWLQALVVVGLVCVSTPVLGAYLARVFDATGGRSDRAFGPVERLIFRAGGIDPAREQSWQVYAGSLLAFSGASVALLYAIERLQGVLPGNPTGMDGVNPVLAFNTAVSFVTNTNWQNYAGESTMSALTQVAGLTVQNFASAAVGLAVAVALIRGLTRRGRATIGNFWVDVVRGVVRVLIPLSLVLAVVLVAGGVVQNLAGFHHAHTLEGATQLIPGGQVASQEAIKEIGTNGGGIFNANSAHPLENPTPITDILEIWALLAIPFALTFAFGRMCGDRRQGWAVFAAMFVLWAASAAIAMQAEGNGNPRLATAAAVAHAPNLEGKEVRFGTPASGLFAASTTGTSTGSVNASHDSFTPVGGGVTLANMMLGEVSPGGVGAGMYGMLVFALLSVFLAGLMVGRTPEYLGKKIQAAEMKLVVLYLLAVPVLVLVFTGISLVTSQPRASILNDGPHGLSEMLYAFTSASNNNGSAFGGLSGNTDWFNTTLAVAMLCGRFLLIVPVLAIAGSLARKHPAPVGPGTFPTGTPLFAGLLVAVVLIVVGLTYFPVMALGPILEAVTP